MLHNENDIRFIVPHKNIGSITKSVELINSMQDELKNV